MIDQSFPPSEEDEWLARVCDFEFEEATFDEWKKTHESLDVLVNRTVSVSKAGRSPTVKVQYTRATYEYKNGVLENVLKEKKEVTIEIKDMALGEHCFEYPGLGDCRESQKGDLKVILIVTE